MLLLDRTAFSFLDVFTSAQYQANQPHSGRKMYDYAYYDGNVYYSSVKIVEVSDGALCGDKDKFTLLKDVRPAPVTWQQKSRQPQYNKGTGYSGKYHQRYSGPTSHRKYFKKDKIFNPHNGDVICNPNPFEIIMATRYDAAVSKPWRIFHVDGLKVHIGSQQQKGVSGVRSTRYSVQPFRVELERGYERGCIQFFQSAPGGCTASGVMSYPYGSIITCYVYRSEFLRHTSPFMMPVIPKSNYTVIPLYGTNVSTQMLQLIVPKNIVIDVGSCIDHNHRAFVDSILYLGRSESYHGDFTCYFFESNKVNKVAFPIFFKYLDRPQRGTIIIPSIENFRSVEQYAVIEAPADGMTIYTSGLEGIIMRTHALLPCFKGRRVGELINRHMILSDIVPHNGSILTKIKFSQNIKTPIVLSNLGSENGCKVD